MNLTDLVNAFTSGDFARPNLFEVEIPFMGKDFKFKCKSAAMPAGMVEKVQIGYQNRKLNIAGDRQYDDWVVTVYSEQDHSDRQAFLDWQALAHATADTISGEVPDQYKKTGVIRQFDRRGNIMKEYKMIGIWPVHVAEIQFDWDENNSIAMFEVTLALDWFE